MRNAVLCPYSLMEKNVQGRRFSLTTSLLIAATWRSFQCLSGSLCLPEVLVSKTLSFTRTGMVCNSWPFALNLPKCRWAAHYYSLWNRIHYTHKHKYKHSYTCRGKCERRVLTLEYDSMGEFNQISLVSFSSLNRQLKWLQTTCFSCSDYINTWREKPQEPGMWTHTSNHLLYNKVTEGTIVEWRQSMTVTHVKQTKDWVKIKWMRTDC